MAEPRVGESAGSVRAHRQRLERIRQLRSQLDARWSAVIPPARQAAALELARDEVPWLLEEIDLLANENEPPRAPRRRPGASACG